MKTDAQLLADVEAELAWEPSVDHRSYAHFHCRSSRTADRDCAQHGEGSSPGGTRMVELRLTARWTATWVSTAWRVSNSSHAYNTN